MAVIGLGDMKWFIMVIVIVMVDTQYGMSVLVHSSFLPPCLCYGVPHFDGHFMSWKLMKLLKSILCITVLFQPVCSMYRETANDAPVSH